MRSSMSQGNVVRARQANIDYSVATPKELVHRFGGAKVINKVLIASNGIAALNWMKSIRRWSYETFKNERAIKFVVIGYPGPVTAAEAECYKYADQYVLVLLPEEFNQNNLANAEFIAGVAKRLGVQAVWAGCDQPSEKAELPDLLNESNIAFIGAPRKSMSALREKMATFVIDQTKGKPTPPSFGSELKAESTEEGTVNKPELLQRGVLQTLDEAQESAEKMGFPVMVKAIYGKDEKGDRKVDGPEDLKHYFHQVQSETPGSPIFLMKFPSCARHYEVRVLGDQYGAVTYLYPRQRMEINEEGAPVVNIFEMEEAAVRLAEMVGYVSVGTVKYLYDIYGNYFFLELNPPLEVEDPNTEMLSDDNLPAYQLQVAMGLPLHQMRPTLPQAVVKLLGWYQYKKQPEATTDSQTSKAA